MKKKNRNLVFSADYIYTPGWIVKFQPKLQTSAIHPLSKPLNFRFKKTLNHNIHHLHVQIWLTDSLYVKASWGFELLIQYLNQCSGWKFSVRSNLFNSVPELCVVFLKITLHQSRNMMFPLLKLLKLKFYIARNRRNVYRSLVGWGGKCG